MEIEEKLIIAKLMDKIKLSKTRNKIINTEFLNIYEKEIIKKELNKNKIKNYFFFGAYEGAEGEILIIYPEKLEKEIVENNLDNIIKVIKIMLPKELKGLYTHRDYLGAVMQTGLNRNRIGDIIVHEDSSYIIVLKENAEYIVSFLKELKRFNKSKIEIINFKEIKIKEQEFEEIKINLSSARLDNFISEIAKISRKKAEEVLQEEKIFINSRIETKGSKTVREDDILVIRGKGKFLISEITKNNKKNKLIAIIKKYK